MEAVGQLPPQDWLTFPETVKVMNALMAGGNTVRFVGGCVRDALAGRAISDVDIATTEPPTKVVRLLKDAGIQVVPIGLDHGSVLAVQPHMTYHITTLRADLETYGRHALVNYIDDWKEDAVRRDFTMNALYADLDGTFYDPAGGLEDIKTGCVRFIGDPMERIQEDYLRILRFFRFQAYYGKVPPAQEQLEACQQTAPHLRQLSGERVWYELKRLLLADNPTAVLEQMEAYGILSVLFSFPTSTINVGLLVKLEQQYNVPNNPIRRLACMVGKNFEAARHIRDDMTLSTQELSSLIMLTKLMHESPDLSIPYENYRLLYEHGPDMYLDHALLNHVNIDKHLEYIQHWNHPKLPLRGQDLMGLGIATGPKIGIILHDLTQWWLEEACKPTQEDCLEWLRSRNKL